MRNKIILTTLLICCLFNTTIKAQTTKEVFNKTFIAELGGAGILFSANFDSRFKSTERLGWGYRVGLGYFPGEFRQYNSNGSYNYRTKSTVSIPLGVNYLFGKSNSDKMFEVGAGVTISARKVSLSGDYNYDSEYKEGNLIGHCTFMYRKQPIEGGFTWRIGFTPLIGTDGQIAFSAGVGLGYCFSK